MGLKLNISLLLSLVSLTAAASLQEDNSEGEGRFLFANYTSGEASMTWLSPRITSLSPPV